MLIRGFDVRKLVGAVWDEGKLGLEFEDCDDPVTEIRRTHDIWKLTGLEAPDQAEHDDDKEQC